MDFNEYQDKAMSFRLFNADELYAVLNLTGEVGELNSLLAKSIRDGEPEGFRDSIKKELGDILWHVAAIADDVGVPLDQIAELNIEKLTSRKQRGVITGSGDNR